LHNAIARLDAGDFARDHDLPGAVVVRWNHLAPFRVGGGARAQDVDGIVQVAKDRRHGPRARGPGLGHQPTALAHEAHRRGEGQGAGRVVGGELTQRMPRRRTHAPLEGVAHDCPGGRAVREQRRLRVGGEGQRVGGPLEAERGKRLA
jgi:hypothetical protein